MLCEKDAIINELNNVHNKLYLFPLHNLLDIIIDMLCIIAIYVMTRDIQ